MQTVEVTGTASAYDPRRDDTASQIVVNNGEIVKHGDTNVLDVLKRLPGVTVSGGAGRMRGLSSGYTQILINGERAPAGFSMDSLAPDVIERIEVMRAASAEFSTLAVAGTINIVLKKAISKAQREVKGGRRRRQGDPRLQCQPAAVEPRRQAVVLADGQRVPSPLRTQHLGHRAGFRPGRRAEPAA
jgi:outer membrane receptor for ferrienterochelin and colicin